MFKKFFQKPTLEQRITAHILELQKKCDILEGYSQYVRFQRPNYQYFASYEADFDLGSNGYSTIEPSRLSEKIQFLTALKENLYDITIKELDKLKKKYPMALDGYFSEVKSIVSELEQTFAHNYPLEEIESKPNENNFYR